MLEQLRRSSQSLLIYVLFGIVIAVFIINFGPQSQGGCESSVSRASYAAKVGSGEVTNPLVALFGARRIAGFYRRGHACPDAARFVEWRDDEQAGADDATKHVPA